MKSNERVAASRSAKVIPAIRFAAALCLFACTLARVNAASPAHELKHALTPDFGPNVLVLDSSMQATAIQAQIDKVYATQQKNEFGPERNALLFLPGEYHVDVPVGFYTQVIGLGASPDAVHIIGNVHSDASLPRNNATCTFWRAAEGFSVTPAGGTMQWAVSQAVPFRRMHVRGNLVLHQSHGWASGGWMSDSLIDGNTDSGSQQQWFTRNSEWASWTGSNWNMVFLGVVHPPAGQWPTPPYTTIAQTPIVREKPFLMVNAQHRWSIVVPALRTNSVASPGGAAPRPAVPYRSVASTSRPRKDTAVSINSQLALGKHLLFTPGIYELTEPIRVTHSDTVIIGLGFATLRPTRGTAAITTGDADGIILAGLLIDAGETKSPVLMEVGPQGSKASHSQNPISLHDVFFRVGGAGVGRAVVNLRINSNNTIIDHTWIWRADHGAGVGWESNLSSNGLVVNGNDVTAYGLFVEHHQEFQVLWNGNGGRTYFYQSEIPYDPPDQASYSSAQGVNGWASYKVADSVTSHEAWGLVIYSVFRRPNVKLTRAIEVPAHPNIRFHSMITVALDDKGEISNVINDAGGPTSIKPRTTPKLTSFP
jgi:hypothetical protein